LEVAKWFINAADREAGDAVTHLKVQKLVYYAQGWALALLNEPLFSEDLQAWAHGPVAPSVWSRFRNKGYEALPEQSIYRRFSGDTLRLLEQINEKYGIFSAKRLERMTHQEGPWREARGNLPPEARCSNVIRKEAMKDFFAQARNGGFSYR
jgi:uncharacterized phage-associated protein